MFIQRGDKGEKVKYVQNLLMGKGYALPKYGADSDFGGETEQAVFQFQAAHGLTVDGKVGDKTLALLEAGEPATPPKDVLREEKARAQELYTKALTKTALPAKKKAVIAKTLDYAIDQLGLKEIPNGSNAGAEIQHLVRGPNQYWWVLKAGVDVNVVKERGYVLPEEAADPQAWCGYFVMNCIREGYGLPYWNLQGYRTELVGHPFKYFLGGPQPVEVWGQEQERRYLPTNVGKVVPGTLVTMGRGISDSDPTNVAGAGHILMALGDDPEDEEYFYAIEGNVSNKVAIKRRKKTDMRWFITWW